ncbi:MAG: cation diffusion facilitator family transporter [Acidimicrobiales bacterium]
MHDHSHPGHGHGHGHGHGQHAGARHLGRLWAAFALVAGFLGVQTVAALLTGSLALLSDAGHLATDAVGLLIAATAVVLARRPSTDRSRTFGWYRLEIVAAALNAALLLVVAVWVAIEAIGRLADPEPIDGPVVLVVGVLGLLVNVAGFLLLRSGRDESLNVEGAYLEVVADLIGSVAVTVGGVVIVLTGWTWVDAVLGVAIGAFVVPRALGLGRRALRILTQAAPGHLDSEVLRSDLAALPGVVDVHDLHVWTLTSGMDVLTAHVMVTTGTDTHCVLDQARDVLAARHGITHATLQVEPEDHQGCDDVGW